MRKIWGNNNEEKFLAIIFVGGVVMAGILSLLLQKMKIKYKNSPKL